MTADRRGPLDRELLARAPALRRHLVVGAVCAAATALLIVAQAEFVARTLVSLIEGRTAPLTAPFVALVSVGVARAVVVALAEWSGAVSMRRTRTDLRQAVLDHAAMDAAREEKGVAAREVSVATSGLDALDPYVRDYLPALTTAVAVPLAAATRILSVDWVSAAIVVVTVPLIPVFMVLIGQLTERRSRRQWAMLQRLAGHFLDVLEGLPTLRMFGRARAQAESVRRVSEDYRRATVGTLRVAFLSALALELLATLSVAVIAVSIGLRLAGGEMGLEAGLVVLLLAPECYLPLRRVGASFHAAESGRDAIADLTEVLERPVFRDGGRPVSAAGPVTVHDVRVDGRNVWPDGLSVDLRPGTTTAVSGPSGAGKSTFIAALRGRLAGRGGAIEVAGTDLCAIAADAWSDHLVVVPQRPEPCAATVLDEVRGGSTADADAIAGALAQVGLTGFEVRDPATLSGGQLRRVQVARAIAAVEHGGARVVLADEPTAQLDERSSDAVRRALVGLAHERGAIVVVASHDMGWAACADQSIELPSVSARADDRPTGRPESDPALEPTVPSLRVDLADVTDVTDLDPGPTRRWKAVRAAIRPVRARLALAAGLAVAAEVCTLGLAGAAAWLIVRASEQPPLAALAVAVTGIRAFGIGKGVLRYAERLASHDAGFRILGDVRNRLVGRLAEVAPLPGWGRGDLLRRTVDDVDRLLDLVVRIVVPWFAIAVTTTAAVVVMVVLDPAAGAVVAIAAAAVGIALPSGVIRRERRVGTALVAARAGLTEQVLRASERVDQLIGAGMWRVARDGVDRATAVVEDLERRRARERAASRAMVAAAPAVTVAAVFAALGVDPGISAPVIGVLVLWPLAIVEIVAGVSDGARTVPELAASADRVDHLLAIAPPEPGAVPLAPFAPGDRPDVAMAGVVARWPGHQRDLGPYHLAVVAGGRAAVVGPSGSGKSTLAAAMVRLCPIVDGHYEVDSFDARRADADEVRRRVLWIDQHPWIGDSSVRENLRIGDPTASDDRLADALTAVELDGWLRGLPDGLDTMVGRRGHAMSGGEAHRLGIARSLLAGHSIVLFDEPTSHVDTGMGERLLANLDERLGGRTLVVLAHDPPPMSRSLTHLGVSVT